MHEFKYFLSFLNIIFFSVIYFIIVLLIIIKCSSLIHQSKWSETEKHACAKILNMTLSEGSNLSSKTSHQLLTYYKTKSEKLEKELVNLEDLLNQVKAACDTSNELKKELSNRNEEISKLQQIIGELQVHIFRKKEENLKLTVENDQLKIQDYENKKRIKALLMVTGMCERKFLHFITKSSMGTLVQPKLPPKLQKLKETKQNETIKKSNQVSDEVDPQVLLLNNQLLASQLEHHIKITRDEITALLKEKEISDEERRNDRQKFQVEIDLLASKLKQAQDLLCNTTEKLINSKSVYEKEKTSWMEEKDRYLQIIGNFKNKEGIDMSDILGFCINGVGNSKFRTHGGRDSVKESFAAEKEQLNAFYQDQILVLETEVNRLRERAQLCKNKFKEKTEKMTAQVSYLRNKYEDLDRRRQLEAEGFRTDIRMLRERVKELEKKLTKVTPSFQSTEQQQLLVSAQNTLRSAKQLEKELAHMKSKISALESNGDIA